MDNSTESRVAKRFVAEQQGGSAPASKEAAARGLTGGATPTQILEDRLETIGALAERLLTTIQVNPGKPAHAITADLRRIIELAARGHRDE